jgi:hypothetical protein
MRSSPASRRLICQHARRCQPFFLEPGSVLAGEIFEDHRLPDDDARMTSRDCGSVNLDHIRIGSTTENVLPCVEGHTWGFSDGPRCGLLPLSAAEQFSLACIHGRRAEVQAMLAADRGLLDRISAEDRLGLLHRAVAANERDGVRLIVELGADVNGMIPNSALDRAPLHSAAGGGELAMVKLLIDLGADPDLRAYPFHAAPIGWAKYGQHQHSSTICFDTRRFSTQCNWESRTCGVAAAARSVVGAGARSRWRPARVLSLSRHGSARGDDRAANQEGRRSECDGARLLERALARGWADFADVLRRHGARTR